MRQQWGIGWMPVFVGIVCVSCTDSTSSAPASSGSIAWQLTSVVPPLLQSGVAVDSERVYAYASGQTLTAISLRTRSAAWSASIDESLETGEGQRGVSVCRQTVVFGSYLAAYGVDAASGTRRWRWRPSDGGALSFGRPVCDGSDRVVFGTGRPLRVYALDVRSGAEQWRVDLNVAGSADGLVWTPVVSESVVFACTREFGAPLRGRVVALEKSDGRLRWEHRWEPNSPAVDASCAGPPVTTGDRVIFAMDDGRIRALDARDGSVVWTSLPSTLASGPRDERALALAGSLVVASSLSGEVSAYELTTGALRWRTFAADLPATYAVNRSLVADSRSVIGVTLSGWIFSLDVSTGERQWLITAGRRLNERTFLAGPALTDSFVLVGATDGIYAITRPR